MTHEQIQQNAENYAYENHHYRDGLATPRQTIHTMELSYIHGAESRQPEIDYLTNLIRELLVSISRTVTENFTDETKELLQEAEYFLKEQGK